jgi:hypothetical protein
MPLHRSGRFNPSGVGIVTVGNVFEESHCNLTDLTSSWEKQNRVYVHFKNVAGTQKPRSLNISKIKKEKLRSGHFRKILGIF